MLKSIVLLLWMQPFLYGIGYTFSCVEKIFPNLTVKIILLILSISIGSYTGWSAVKYTSEEGTN